MSRTFIKPSRMGWELSDNLGDNRSLKDRAAGNPEQIIATFNFYVQPYDNVNETYLAKTFDQQIQYPGSVIFTQAQIEQGWASLQNIPLSLQNAALTMFENASAAPQNSNVVDLASHRPVQPVRDPEDHRVRQQMFAQSFDM